MVDDPIMAKWSFRAISAILASESRLEISLIFDKMVDKFPTAGFGIAKDELEADWRAQDARHEAYERKMGNRAA